MISGKAQQGHRVPVHVRVEQGVEPVQRRERARRARVVLRRHKRPQQEVDVLGSVSSRQAPGVARAGGPEGGRDVEEALRVDEAQPVGRGLQQLWVIDAEGTRQALPVNVVGATQATTSRLGLLLLLGDRARGRV